MFVPVVIKRNRLIDLRKRRYCYRIQHNRISIERTANGGHVGTIHKRNQIIAFGQVAEAEVAGNVVLRSHQIVGGIVEQTLAPFYRGVLLQLKHSIVVQATGIGIKNLNRVRHMNKKTALIVLCA
jgi:hypothetical protein